MLSNGLILIWMLHINLELALIDIFRRIWVISLFSLGWCTTVQKVLYLSTQNISCTMSIISKIVQGPQASIILPHVKIRIIHHYLVDNWFKRWYLSINSWNIAQSTFAIWSIRYNASQKITFSMIITYNWSSRITLKQLKIKNFLF